MKKNEEPKPHVKTNWIAFVCDNSDKVDVVVDYHNKSQVSSLKLAGNKIVGYIYDTKDGAKNYGQWLLAHPPKPRS